MNFCINCKYATKKEYDFIMPNGKNYDLMCSYPKAFGNIVDKVDGTINNSLSFCSIQREMEITLIDRILSLGLDKTEYCGPKGKWFEPKENI